MLFSHSFWRRESLTRQRKKHYIGAIMAGIVTGVVAGRLGGEHWPIWLQFLFGAALALVVSGALLSLFEQRLK